ncbi:MAG: hypothetical protein H7245_23315 [Candidatus Saccharibacteria bacterium]|nr:hypothetical protein [Pseudorhodobacter sp.]
MGGKEGRDARKKIGVAIGIRANDHVANIVALEIGALAQEGDGAVAGGVAFGLPCGGDRVLAGLQFGEVVGHPAAFGDLAQDSGRLSLEIGGKHGLLDEGFVRQTVQGPVVQAHRCLDPSKVQAGRQFM